MTIRLHIEIYVHGETGLLLATSSEMPELTVYRRSLDEIVGALPAVIEALVKASKGEDVRVTSVEIDPHDGEGWAEYRRRAIATIEKIAA